MTRRRRARRWRNRLPAAGAALCFFGLVLFLTGLEILGPPPPIRIDALWISEHRAEVRICIGGITLAASGLLLTLITRRFRAIGLMAWAFAIVTCVAVFPDRVRIIAKVLLDHYS